jgi:calcineurin-like phosphoesterase family protein
MFKEIAEDYKEFKAWLTDWIFYRRHAVKMSLAIRLADLKQKAFNKQYHIMLLSLPGREKLVSVNRKDIERLKRKKWLPRNTSFFDLKHDGSVFYSTPLYRNNKSSPKERKEAKEKYARYAKKYLSG